MYPQNGMGFGFAIGRAAPLRSSASELPTPGVQQSNHSQPNTLIVNRLRKTKLRQLTFTKPRALRSVSGSTSSVGSSTGMRPFSTQVFSNIPSTGLV